MTFDFLNAFNMVGRKTMLQRVLEISPAASKWANWAYSQHSYLFIGNSNIMSCSGIKQGDPLGPYYFCLVLDALVKAINEKFTGLKLHVWYLDDGTIVCPSSMVKEIYEFVSNSSRSLGLELNDEKCFVYAPTHQPQWDELPPLVNRSTEGLVILGSPVGNMSFISDFAEEKVKELNAAIDLLPEMDNKQAELLLLRACFSNCKIAHLTNTVDPGYLAEALSKFDRKVQSMVEACLGYTFRNQSMAQTELSTMFSVTTGPCPIASQVLLSPNYSPLLKSTLFLQSCPPKNGNLQSAGHPDPVHHFRNLKWT